MIYDYDLLMLMYASSYYHGNQSYFKEPIFSTALLFIYFYVKPSCNCCLPMFLYFSYVVVKAVFSGILELTELMIE